MSILIKGMQMPKNCGECPIEQLYGRDCETAQWNTLKVVVSDG